MDAFSCYCDVAEVKITLTELGCEDAVEFSWLMGFYECGDGF